MTWKFLQIKPQKAKGKLLESYWDDPAWVAEIKYDGDRRISQFCASGLVRFTGTRESVDDGQFVEKTANVPHLSDGRNQTRNGLPPALRLVGTVLDGEMTVPAGTKIEGGSSKYVTSIMGSSPEEAVRKQRERGHLCYVVFDCLWHKGRDIRDESLRIRRNFAEQAAREWANPYVSLASQAVGAGKRDFYDRIVGGGGEGVVLKHVDSKYGAQALWVKVKAEATADVVMLGAQSGKGKYLGTLGAIVFGQMRKTTLRMRSVITLEQMGTCSGMTDEERAKIWRRSKQYTGQVFRIRHNGREPTGAFRHPRFDGWRPDKSPKDCVYDPEES